MHEHPMANIRWPGLPRAIALLVLFGLSGGIVWSYHNTDGTTFIAALVFGCFFGFLAGGLVGVHLFPSLGMMVVCGGIIEGVVQGWSRYGLVGAGFGGLIGIAAACVMVGLPMMLSHFILIVCGIDPLACPDLPAATGTDVEGGRGGDDES